MNAKKIKLIEQKIRLVGKKFAKNACVIYMFVCVCLYMHIFKNI